MRRSRQRARWLSEYVDARIRRAKPSEAARADEGASSDRPLASGEEFDRLLDLARVMDDLDLRPAPEEASRQFARLELEALREVPSTSVWSARRVGQWVWRLWAPLSPNNLFEGVLDHGRVRHLVYLGLSMTVIAAATLARGAAALSAVEVERRADAAMERLVEPGKVLHRRSHVRIYFNGAASPVSEEIVDEWTDGSPAARLGARGRAMDGRLLWTQVNAWENGALRVHLYRTPDSPFAPKDVVVIRPTTSELRTGLEAFPVGERERLRAYLQSGRASYEPIVGERLVNRAWLDATRHGSTGALAVVGWETPEGHAGYRLRSLQAGQPWLEWAGDGVIGRTMTVERVRYLEASTYLTRWSETVMSLADGGRWRSVREAWFSRQEVAAQADPEAFRLGAPEGTRVLRVSARQELEALASALATTRMTN